MPKNRKVTRSPRKPKSNASRPSRKAKAPARAPRPERPARSDDGGPSREIVGILGLGTAIFVVAALVSLQAGSGRLMGPFGRTIAGTAYGFAGMCSYLLAIALAWTSVRLLADRPIARYHETAGAALLIASLATLMHLAGSDYRVAGHATGGLLGEHIAEVFRALISTAGTALLAVTGLVMAVVIATPLRMRQLGGYAGRALRWCGRGIAVAAGATASFSGEVVRAVLPERDRDEYLDGDFDYHDDDYDAYELDESDPAFVDPPIIEGGDTAPTAVPVRADDSDTERMDSGAVISIATAAKDRSKANAADNSKDSKGKDDDGAIAVEADDVVDEVAADSAADNNDNADDGGEVILLEQRKKSRSKKSRSKAKDADSDEKAQPVIVESRFSSNDADAMRKKEAEADAERLEFIPLGDGEYKLPPINILDYDESQRDGIDRTAMLELSARLTQTLENYGVKGEVVAIRPGPVVTMYEFAPAPGTRINKIVNLSDDLAMVLEALSVRIVAPIPGKAAVGIEVPNKSRETVFLKEILADGAFRKSKHKLPLALGKDIEGAPSVVDLAKMPHLLVAGTTGSGKSVSVNSMITSLLYHSTPEDVRLIMVDPKMLELSIYEGVPHLLLPVVTDPKKANLALRWAVDEMERRYELLASMGVRDLVSYNRKAARLRAEHEAAKLRRDADAMERLAALNTIDAAYADEPQDITAEHEPVADIAGPPKHLPYIVIIIDEFADLMMCAPKEVETSVARIAQKARAAGIHLILATQRPSVDVITGLIKANFPSRAAFRVTSKVDSRTVLDQGGAESLLGAGDMLFSDRGAAPCRYHGCFVGEDEIGRVVDFLKTQGKPIYNMDILKPREEETDEAPAAAGDEPVDEMYDRAVALVSETRQVSISMIQRRLRVGYNRAARMVEHMEREGVVSPPDHTNKREVLVEAA